MNAENRTGVSAHPPDEPAWPPPAYAWYVIGVLTFAALFLYIDRQILTLMIDPIRSDLGISDTQVSLLGGFAIAVFSTLMGIPIGWLADHYSRRLIIAIGVVLWSLMTAFSGLSRTFGQLFLARVGVGIGEAALTPPAYSLIADYFPPRRLGRAIGVFMTAVTLGNGLALVVGGAVLDLVADLPPMVLPLIGAVKSWQFAFLAVALPGVLVVALMATVKEPFRRGRMAAGDGAPAGGGATSLRATVAFTAAHWKTYVPIFTGFAMLVLVVHAVIVWTPTLYIRTWGWSASSIGYAFGLSLLVFGPLGAVGGGWLCDVLLRRGHDDAALRVTTGLLILFAPTAAIMPLLPSAELSLIPLAMLAAMLSAFGTLVPTALQLVTPNRFRAQVTAFSLFTVNLLGAGLGPTIVALITDYGFADDLALRYSLAIVAAVFAPLAAVIFWSGLKAYRGDAIIANAANETGAQS